jgi:hypothetical protein
MRCSLLLIGVAACGGGSKQTEPVKPVPDVKADKPTRIPVEDDEHEDGVEVISTHGRMEPATVEAGLAPHKEALSDCYMSRVGRRRWLGGHVTLHWDIDKTGEIKAVKLAESDLGAWPVEKCLLETARGASFGKPIGGAADFVVPLDFTAKGKAMSWDEDQSLRAVGGQVVKLDDCAKAKGVKGPLPDDVTITVYVGPGGKAQSVGFSSAKSVLDDAWADCAEAAALKWRLPDPRGQVAKLAVKYRAK